jgi:hypothetical protein
MRAFLNVFFDVAMLRSGPQDLPRSRFLFWLTFSLMLMLALLQGAFIFEPLKNLMFGISTIFRLLELPAYFFIQANPQNWAHPVFILSILLVLGLRIYHIFVMGHIFCNTMGYTMTAGVLTAMGYVVVNFTLIRLVFG